MADESLVEPRADAPQPAPEVEPQPQSQEQAQAGSLPPALVNLPAMQAIVAGSPPAVSAPIADFSKRPEAKLLAQNKAALEKAGFGFYRSLSGDTGVIFNQLHIAGADIQAADKMGKLQLVAPPFDAVEQAVAKSGINNPVFQAQVPKAAATPVSAGTPPQSASTPSGGMTTAPAPVAGRGQAASAQRQALKQRMQLTQPGEPTSGPSPGAGRLMNAILTPAV